MTAELARWQAETAARLLDGTGVAPSGSATPAQTAGWPTTVALYRQWRAFRIQSLAPLTLRALGRRADLVASAYLAANPGSTSYAGTDASGFLTFVAGTDTDDAVLQEITFLEQAFLLARQPATVDPESPGMLRRSARAVVRRVPLAPVPLMLWLAGHGEQPTPAPGGAIVVVAPGITGWFRPASTTELAAWEWLATDRPLRTGRHAGAVQELRRIGAVLAA